MEKKANLSRFIIYMNDCFDGLTNTEIESRRISMKNKSVLIIILLFFQVFNSNRLIVTADSNNNKQVINQKINEGLEFVSVPRSLNFGSHQSFYDKDKNFGLEGTYNDLVIKDNRNLDKQSHWQLEARLISDFTGEKTGNVMKNVLYFNNQLVSSDSVVTITQQNKASNDEIDLSNKLHGSTGLQLRIQPQQIKSDHYRARMSWILSDGVENN